MSPPQPRCVNPKIWQRCAGAGVIIPKLHSKVYYFPKGHLEHACTSPNDHTINIINRYRPSIPCIISTVDLLADPYTDEVFAKLLLTPVTDGFIQESPRDTDQEDKGDDNVVSFVKILTKSDSNNAIGFSVPRACADLILPKLEFEVPMRSQKIFVTDVQGEVWNYNHTYHGKPKRHVLNNGWTLFVNKKKLVAGDSVVFMKNLAGKVFVGIRRHMKFAAAEAAAVPKEKLTEKTVIKAAELAEKSMAFEVVYYPSPNWNDFVVDAKVVDEAIKINWESGMGVKLSLKNEESLRMRYVQPQGTISNVSNALSNVPNWRMLQVILVFFMHDSFR